jgi:hypothetical protein
VIPQLIKQFWIMWKKELACLCHEEAGNWGNGGMGRYLYLKKIKLKCAIV